MHLNVVAVYAFQDGARIFWGVERLKQGVFLLRRDPCNAQYWRSSLGLSCYAILIDKTKVMKGNRARSRRFRDIQ